MSGEALVHEDGKAVARDMLNRALQKAEKTGVPLRYDQIVEIVTFAYFSWLTLYSEGRAARVMAWTILTDTIPPEMRSDILELVRDNVRLEAEVEQRPVTDMLRELTTVVS